eukprot:559496-Pleurochrysis_carterae.AAC.1
MLQLVWQVQERAHDSGPMLRAHALGLDATPASPGWARTHPRRERVLRARRSHRIGFVDTAASPQNIACAQ